MIEYGEKQSERRDYARGDTGPGGAVHPGRDREAEAGGGHSGGQECAPEHAKLVQDFLDMTERQVSHQLDRLEAVETLYRIETGTRLGLLAELAEEGQDDGDF